jgi:hypothetical protein
VGLGFAGICRETYRVGIRALINKKGCLGAAVLSALLLVHAAVFTTGKTLVAVQRISAVRRRMVKTALPCEITTKHGK